MSAARDAVDRGVVDLRVDGHPAAGQAGDQVHLPQRPRPVQGACVQPSRLLGQHARRCREAAARSRGRGTRGRSRGPRSSRAGRARTAPVASRRRNGGTRCSRELTTSLRLSSVSGSGAVDGSTTQMLPTCPNTAGVSIARKAPSSPVSCCIVVLPRRQCSLARRYAPGRGSANSRTIRRVVVAACVVCLVAARTRTARVLVVVDRPGAGVDQSVVVSAEQDHVGQRGRSAVDPVLEVVGVAHQGWPGAAGEAAVPVADDEGFPDRGGDEALLSSDVEDLARCAEDGGDDLGVAADPRGRR